jgi:hypothetical protein
MDTELKDICGVPFAVGDWVATDTMSYRTSSLRVGVVTEFDGKKVKVTYKASTQRSVWRRPDGVVKVAQ